MTNIKAFFADKRVRVALVILIIALTMYVFASYLVQHPETLRTLLHLPPWLLGLLTLGYLGAIAANAYVLHESLGLLGKRAQFSDNIALTSYSSIINFFGPLQSGPGARALYLKSKYGVRFRDFLGTTLIFYAFFGVINLAILAIALLVKFPDILTIFGVVLLIVFGSILSAFLRQKSARFRQLLHAIKLHNRHTWLIGLGAFLLILATAFTYYFELIYVDHHVNFWQAVVYSAAGNLALFVSLTPGAIGFRETFLVFSEKLHGIATQTVLAASIIDRAFYIVFLAVLFVALLLLSRALGLSFFLRSSAEKSAHTD